MQESNHSKIHNDSGIQQDEDKACGIDEEKNSSKVKQTVSEKKTEI